MDLRQFVSMTLQQIVGGVQDAQTAVGTYASINPGRSRTVRGSAADGEVHISRSGEWIHMVDFDVALTVTEGTGTQGGLGIAVGPLVVGSKGQSSSENSSVSRIKFQVPITLPKMKADAPPVA